MSLTESNHCTIVRLHLHFLVLEENKNKQKKTILEAIENEFSESLYL